MLLDPIAGWFSHDLAIDLGTANTLVYGRGQGLICSEPSVVAVAEDRSGRGQKVLAVGHQAKEMLGRTPGSISAIRPIKDGVIADFEVTEAMLRYFIQRAHNRVRLARPRIVICVPPCITSVEKRAVRESALSAGAREGLPDRGADGGCDRRGARRHGTHGQHGRRHRRRHHRRRSDLAERHRHLALDPHGRRQDGRCDHPLRQAQVQHARR